MSDEQSSHPGGKALVHARQLARRSAELVRIETDQAEAVRQHATEALSVTAKGAGRLAKAVARAPLTKDVASYAAIGAAVAMPLPIVGSAFGAAVGAGLGLLRNLTRQEVLAPPVDPIAEIERLHDLLAKGALTEEEFQTQKHKLLK